MEDCYQGHEQKPENATKLLNLDISQLRADVIKDMAEEMHFSTCAAELLEDKVKLFEGKLKAKKTMLESKSGENKMWSVDIAEMPKECDFTLIEDGKVDDYGMKELRSGLNISDFIDIEFVKSLMPSAESH